MNQSPTPTFALGQRIRTLLEDVGSVVGRMEPTPAKGDQYSYIVRLDDGRRFVCLDDVLEAA